MKIIGLFSNSDDLVEEKKVFKELAKHYARFMDLKFYMVFIFTTLIIRSQPTMLLLIKLLISMVLYGSQN
jgi:hypothetical protein